MNLLTTDRHGQSLDQTARPRPVSARDPGDECRVRLPSDRFTAHLAGTLTLGEWRRAWAAQQA